jgi:excisionase family DNA binding protein
MTRSMTVLLHTAEEAANLLRVRRSWLERQAAARRVPFTMLGGSYRFTDEHLAAIVSLHERAPSEQQNSRTTRRQASPQRRPKKENSTKLRARPRPAPRRPEVA